MVDSTELPKDFLVAVVQQLEKDLDSEPLDPTCLIKQISILRRFNYQEGVKISHYGKCFLTVVRRAGELDKIIIKDFFGLIEQLLDPRRNWRDQNCSQDSICRLLGSIGDFIKIIIRAYSGDLSANIPKSLQIHILNLYGVALSSNLKQHLLLALTEKNSNLLLFLLRSEIESDTSNLEKIELLSKIAVRIVHALHSYKGWF